MKILFVTPRLPLPADTGAKIRTYNLLKCAAENNDVSILSFYFEDNKNAVEKLKSIGIDIHLVKAKERTNPFSILSKKPISIEKYRSKNMEYKLKYLVNTDRLDLIHFDHLHMGQYSDCINGKRCIIDDHNVESTLLSRCAMVNKNMAKRQLFKSQEKKMAALESKLVNRATKCLVVSDTDKDNLTGLLEEKREAEC